MKINLCHCSLCSEIKNSFQIGAACSNIKSPAYTYKITINEPVLTIAFGWSWKDWNCWILLLISTMRVNVRIKKQGPFKGRETGVTHYGISKTAPFWSKGRPLLPNTQLRAVVVNIATLRRLLKFGHNTMKELNNVLLQLNWGELMWYSLNSFFILLICWLLIRDKNTLIAALMLILGMVTVNRSDWNRSVTLNLSNMWCSKIPLHNSAVCKN